MARSSFLKTTPDDNTVDAIIINYGVLFHKMACFVTSLGKNCYDYRLLLIHGYNHIEPNMPATKPNLIILSYYDPGSGFFTVISNLAPRLQEGYEIHYLGIGYHGDIKKETHWILHPGKMDGDDFAGQACYTLAQQLGSGIILIINDLWISALYKPRLSPLKSQWSILAYTPIDGHIQDENIIHKINFLDTLVVYTEFAKTEIHRISAQINKTSNTTGNIPIQVIPHGIDNAFYKMDGAEKKAARAEFFQKDDWQDALVILNANKISERKRIDLTLQAFHLFSNNKPDVRLYLHHSHIAPEYHARLIKKLQTLGLDNKVLITPPQPALMPKQKLNRLYNACDIGINTSVGEGWGLISFEHAATGAAQIVPDHSACTELWKGNAEMISPKVIYQAKDRPDTLMQEMDVLSAVDALNRIYIDKTHRQVMADKAYAVANDPCYQWETIAKQWIHFLHHFS